jgi:hypothetical protein
MRRILRFYLLVFFASLFLSDTSYSQSWTQLFPTNTTQIERGGNTGVYDTTNNRMVIFGGVNDTAFLNDVWVLSNTNGLDTTTSAWTQLNPLPDPLYGLPTARYRHTAVYDNINNRMTIFGGQEGTETDYNDVWVLSNANGLNGTPAWTQLTPNPDPTQTTNGYGGFPASRASHTAVYNTANNQMIIFGGGHFDIGALDDVWVLSHANGLGGTPAWTQLSPSGSTSLVARYDHTATYDPINNIMTIFGGENENYLNDTWILTNANGMDSTISTWQQLIFTGGIPSARLGHSAIYDSVRNQMVIFGGLLFTFPENFYYFNDVWVLNYANGLGGTPYWNQLSPLGNLPVGREDHTAVYDNTHNIMTIFGGGNESSALNDVWVLNHANDITTSVPKEIWELYDE